MSRSDIPHTFLTVAAPLVLASIKSLQHREGLNQSALLFMQNDWKIIGLAEVLTHDITNKVPNCFAWSVRGCCWEKRPLDDVTWVVSLMFLTSSVMFALTKSLNALIYSGEQLENVKINLQAIRTL